MCCGSDDPVGFHCFLSQDGVVERQGVHYKEKDFNLNALSSFLLDHREVDFHYGEIHFYSLSEDRGVYVQYSIQLLRCFQEKDVRLTTFILQYSIYVDSFDFGVHDNSIVMKCHSMGRSSSEKKIRTIFSWEGVLFLLVWWWITIWHIPCRARSVPHLPRRP